MQTTLTAFITLACAATASAGLGPFTETFDNSASNWVNSPGTAFLDHVTDGGPNGAGDGYASGTFNFLNAAADDNVVIHRAQDEFNASGNAFVGNYIESGIDFLTFDFRHNLPVPASVFTRITPPANFPGAIGVNFAPVLPNQWTTIAIPLTAGSPQFVSFEGATFESIFSNVGHIQFGVTVGDAFAGLDADFIFDIDNVSIVPTPGTFALLAATPLLAARRRRD